MLVLSLRTVEADAGQSRVRLRIGDVDVWVTLVGVAGDKARLGFEAPPHVQIVRGELIDRYGEKGLRCAKRGNS